ncbi:MAG: phosphate acyltransferase PlsX [Clostridiales bacterium]|nr:phosphate acyltransferase PlsX [Clostridiales bacterium]
MKVVVDAFGGDHAPGEIVKGVVAAVERQGITAVLTGDRQALERLFAQQRWSDRGIELVDASEVIGMEEEPVAAVRQKKNSSLVVAMRLLADGAADAFVGASSTGAMLTAAVLIVRRIRGVLRPALAPVLPSRGAPFLLIDAGANAECRAEQLEQFGLMGSLYMEQVFGVASPRVGLLNIGAEPHKGTALQIEAYARLQAAGLNFVGNLEGTDALAGRCDVLVADGYAGNIFLKSAEGAAAMFTGLLRELFQSGLSARAAAALIASPLKQRLRQIDSRTYGGTALLGISKPVIKAHGSSDATAIENAIGQARRFHESGMTRRLEEALAAKSPPADPA